MPAKFQLLGIYRSRLYPKQTTDWVEILTTGSPYKYLTGIEKFLKTEVFTTTGRSQSLHFWSNFDSNLPAEDGRNRKRYIFPRKNYSIGYPNQSKPRPYLCYSTFKVFFCKHSEPPFWFWAHFPVLRPKDEKKKIRFSDAEFYAQSFEKKIIQKYQILQKLARPWTFPM